MDAAILSSLDERDDLGEWAKVPHDAFGEDLSGRRRVAELRRHGLFAAPVDNAIAPNAFEPSARRRGWLRKLAATIGGEFVRTFVREPGDQLAEVRAAAPQTVRSPSTQYTLIRQLAAGDLADVHLAEADGRELVLKITRPVAGNRFLVAEARRLQALAARSGDRSYREFVPRLVESFSHRGPDGSRQVNVFRHRLGFFTLEEVRRQHPSGLDGRHLAWVFKRLLTVLGFAHSCDLVHGAVLPPHVMIHAENHGLQLVDWIHAAPIGETLDLVLGAFREWYPREALNYEPAGPATDIYLAAKCMIYLAGGDPLAERCPSEIPRPMRQFMETCLYRAARMRPQDAWKLHEEFDELLGRLFGPPKYHRLVMA